MKGIMELTNQHRSKARDTLSSVTSSCRAAAATFWTHASRNVMKSINDVFNILIDSGAVLDARKSGAGYVHKPYVFGRREA